MTTTRTVAVEDRRAELEEARRHERALSREADELPAKLEEIGRREYEELVEAGRQGNATGPALTFGSEIVELKQREGELPYLLRGARLRVAELEAEMLRLDEREAAPKIRDARADLERAVEELRVARERRSKAEAAVLGAERRADDVRRRRKEAEQRIRDLQDGYTG